MEDYQVAPRREAMRDRWLELETLVSRARHNAKTWETTPEGRFLQSLERKDKKCKTQITAAELLTLATLDATFSRLGQARDLARKVKSKR